MTKKVTFNFKGQAHRFEMQGETLRPASPAIDSDLIPDRELDSPHSSHDSKEGLSLIMQKHPDKPQGEVTLRGVQSQSPNLPEKIIKPPVSPVPPAKHPQDNHFSDC